jgi:hypothetical protein
LGTRRARKKKIRAVVRATTVVVVVAAALFVIWQNYPRQPSSNGMQEFFSDDDGQNWFADDGTKIPPFDHNGKSAVMVKVYAGKDGNPFVGYMMKFTGATKKQIEGATHQARPGLSAEKTPSANGILVKRPHDKDWIPDGDPKAREIKKVGPDCVPVRP